MELNIKHRLLKTIITTTDKQALFIIKNQACTELEKIISRPDGMPVYSIKKDPIPLDHRDKYIFTDYISKNEFFAWIDHEIFKIRKPSLLYRCFLFSPLEIYIEAESFFGELSIRRSGISRFDIFINGRKKGIISRKKVICDDIDDAGLLSVLYAFTDYIINSEEVCRIADAT